MGHKLTSIGASIWLVVQSVAGLTTIYYKRTGATEPPGYALLLYGTAFLVSLVMILIGGFLDIGASYGAIGVKGYLYAFVKEGVKVTKLPLLVSLIVIILFLLFAIIVLV